MATLLPSMSSDEENDIADDSEDEVGDVNQEFSFGGLLVSKVCVDIIMEATTTCSFILTIWN
jgi:hypothetical protein